MIDTTKLFNLIPVPRWLTIPGVVRELRNEEDGSLYLRRFYLSPRHYIHQIADADADRYLHNHPWEHAESFILFGGYWEVREGGRGCWRLADEWVELEADTYHRIAIVLPGTWTYFVHGPRNAQGWGFLVDGKHIDWKDLPKLSMRATVEA